MGRAAEAKRSPRGAPESLRALSRLFRETERPPVRGEVAPVSLARFVEQSLAAYAVLPRLLELWARVSVPGPGGDAPRWHRAGASPERETPEPNGEELFLDTVCASGAELVELPDRGWDARWAVIAPVGRWPSHWGVVMATFAEEQHAREAILDIECLATDLELGVRLVRRYCDSNMLRRLSVVVAEAQRAQRALSDVVELIRDHTGADGASVHIVIPAVQGVMLRQVYPESLADTQQAGAATGLDLGLVRWVIEQDDWLLVADRLPAERAAVDPETALTGRHDWVQVRSHQADEAADSSFAPPRWRSTLIAPMHSQERVVGAIGVSRMTGDAFDAELDTASLLALAPHVASACKQILQIEQMEEEMRSVSRLAAALVPATSVADAYGQITAEIGKLARADAAVLLQHDPKRPGHLYFGHAWAARPDELSPLHARLHGLHEACGVDPARWEERIAAALLAEVMGSVAAYSASGSLRLFPPGDDGLPRAAVWLSRRQADEPNASPFALSDVLSSTFVQYASAMLENHVHAYASTVVGAIGRPPELSITDPAEVLQWAAELVKQATGCDAALIYSGESEHLMVTRCFPGVPGVVGLPAISGSLTWESVEKAEPRRVLDVEDEPDNMAYVMDRALLEHVIAGYAWSSARSWICCPVVHKGRCVGAIKVLTSNQGRFLGPHQEAIAQAVTERAAIEIHKMSRTLMLEALNSTATQIAGKGGAELRVSMIPALLRWVDRFLRGGCELAIFARISSQLLVFQETAGIDENAARALDEFSRWLGRGAATWKRGARPHPSLGNPHLAAFSGVATPIHLPTQERLAGHLFALHARPFSGEDEAALREAAREMAVLLNGERLRHEWTLNAGLFRHALLGPVQGLTSSARMLGVRATEAGAEVADLVARVDKEAEIIRLWSENQRLYLDGKVEIRPRSQDLRPVVERGLARYKSLFEARSMAVQVQWGSRGPLRFSFDDYGLDLALSNILDNARKYAFFNREVSVGVRVYGPVVQIWIEDIGHPVPERLNTEIYREGRRMDWSDPFRVINGDGLGLAMARAIIEKHDGRLYHSSELAGRDTGDATTPYRVRFTMELPHHWRRHG